MSRKLNKIDFALLYAQIRALPEKDWQALKNLRETHEVIPVLQRPRGRPRVEKKTEEKAG